MLCSECLCVVLVIVSVYLIFCLILFIVIINSQVLPVLCTCVPQ